MFQALVIVIREPMLASNRRVAHTQTQAPQQGPIRHVWPPDTCDQTHLSSQKLETFSEKPATSAYCEPMIAPHGMHKQISKGGDMHHYQSYSYGMPAHL